MIRKLLGLALMVCVGLCLGASPREGEGRLDLEEIIARHLAARGGEDALRSVTSARSRGTIVSAGMTLPFTRLWMRPGRLRLSFQVEGMTVVQAYDGQSGWMEMPLLGENRAKPLGEEDSIHLREQADFEGPLLDHKSKGYEVALLGQETVGSRQVYKLRVDKHDGIRMFVYLDTIYFLEVKREMTLGGGGPGREVEFLFDDYRPTGAIRVPFSTRTRLRGSPASQTMSLDAVDLDVDLEESVFTMPRRK